MRAPHGAPVSRRMMQIDPHEMARRRWRMLARALHKNKEENVDADDTARVSVRRITGFGLVALMPLPCPADAVASPTSTAVDGEAADAAAGAPWYEYRTSIGRESYAIRARHLAKDITPVDLMGFNNTGNVCVWPSEEVLAYYVLRNRRMFDGKTVLELGGGMTCLAGLLVAKFTGASYVHLTDGNASSVDNVSAIVKENGAEDPSRVACSVLQWGDRRHRDAGPASSDDRYDIVLAADCLFFDDGRKDLVATMWRSLKDDGVALVTAPRRGGTLDEFIAEASRTGFRCDPKEHYDEQVWQRHLQLKADSDGYDEDIHYPILIYVTKGRNVDHDHDHDNRAHSYRRTI